MKQNVLKPKTKTVHKYLGNVWSVRVDQAEVLFANGDALRADTYGQPLAICIAGPVPLHSIMLQRRHQLQGLIFHRSLAQTCQSLVSGYDAAERKKNNQVYLNPKTRKYLPKEMLT